MKKTRNKNMKEFVDLHNNEKKEEQILKMKIVIEN
jgi:hypothetical protein